MLLIKNHVKKSGMLLFAVFNWMFLYSQTTISDAAGLIAISNNLSGSYVLTADITLTDTWTPITGFSGTFDGGGHIIKGLSYNNTATEKVALFATTTDATIKNLGIEGANIIAKKDVAAIIGVMTGGVLEQCYVSNSYIQGGDHVASLVGQAVAGTSNAVVRNCYASAYIYATTNNSGGLIASAKACTLSKSYFSGVVRGIGSGQQAAGLVGFIENGYTPTVEYSVNLAPFIISKGGTAMRIIPNIGRNATLTQNYSISTSLIGTSYSLSALSTVETTNTYYGTSGKNGANLPSDEDALSGTFYANTLGWDFTDVWKMLDDGYPVLKWQNSPVNVTVMNSNSPADLSILDVTAAGLRSGNQIDFSKLISSHGIDLNISTDNEKVQISDSKIATLKADVTIESKEEATFNLTAVSSQFMLTNPVATVELNPGIPFIELAAYSYPDGIISEIYNSGPGLAIDKTSVTSEDSKMVVISSTTETSFNTYIQTLLDNGFTQISTNTIEDNVFYTLIKDNKLYYIYFTARTKQVRIIQDNSTNTLLTDLDASVQGNGKTEFYLYSLDYTHGEGQTSKTDYWKIDCGTLIIIKLKDNSLFVIDSGHERQSSKAAMEGLLNFMYNITGQETGTVLDIRGWFISHFHGDHVYLIYPFLTKYHDFINVESVLFNIPSYQTMSSGYDSGTFLMKETFNTYYPNCKYVKLHTGQTFTFQGVEFDVLHTHEDAASTNGKTTIGDGNDTSTILKMLMDGKTFMLLGDASSVCQSDMLSMYSDATLNSNCVQTAHHGYNNLTSLYNLIKAPLAIFCNSEENAVSNTAVFAGVTGATRNVKVCYADPNTTKIYVENGNLLTEDIPSYRSYFKTVDLPELNVQTISTRGNRVNLSTVLSMPSLADSVIDKSVTGTRSKVTGESCSLILDGSTSTKYCTDTIPVTIAWTMKSSVLLKYYVIYSANDNASFSGRNPDKWVISGSNDGISWQNIDSVDNANLPNTNYTGNAFEITNSVPYQYYAIKVFATGGAEVLQFSEIGLYGSESTGLNNLVDEESPVTIVSGERNKLTINYKGIVDNHTDVSICNVLGQTVVNKSLLKSNTTYFLPQGIYIVNIRNSKINFCQKTQVN
ncbi:MAG: hypothetical protein PHH37_12610 [Paludibacter sp.]|nr:hypothetical protein [Paludibacter sp.]